MEDMEKKPEILQNAQEKGKTIKFTEKKKKVKILVKSYEIASLAFPNLI